jgi:hypothetical protein
MLGRKKNNKPVKNVIDGEPVNVARMRDVVFETLAQRVGETNAAVMKADFQGHIDEDPKGDGVEVAYLCLVGKLVDTVDRLMDLMESQSGRGHSEGPISPFLTYRKDG